MFGGGNNSSGASGSGGGAKLPARVEKAIASITEIVSDFDKDYIYEVLKESDMDPNETTQKLLSQAPFQKVKSKRDKRKEIAGQGSSPDGADKGEQNAGSTKSNTKAVRNYNGRDYPRNQSSGFSREFRVSDNNRVQYVAMNKQEPAQHNACRHVFSDSYDKRVVVQTDRKHFPAKTLEGQNMPQDVEGNTNSKPGVLQEKESTVSSHQKHSKLPLKSSSNGGDFSTSDPVHVPSLNSRASGTVGTNRRQVGPVGLGKHPSERSSVRLTDSGTLRDGNLQRGNSTLRDANLQRGNSNTRDANFRGKYVNRGSFVTQHTNKFHLAPAGNQRVVHSNMEWKPKSTKKPTSSSSDATQTTSVSPSVEENSSSNAIDTAASLTDKMAETYISEPQHVIIPEHLRVSESEQSRLRFGSFSSELDSHVPESELPRIRFGSFSSELDSDHGLASAFPPESGNQTQLGEPISMSLGDNEVLSAADHDEVDDQAGSLEHDLSTSVELTDAQPPDTEHLNGQELENNDVVGLVQSNASLLTSDESQNVQGTSNRPAFLAYDQEVPGADSDISLYRLVESNMHSQLLPSTSETYAPGNTESKNDMPIFRIVDTTVHPQVSPSPSEALGLQLAGSSPIVNSTQQQQLIQPQPANQLYPPVHMSHFPNFMQYHHVYSPVYVPSMPMTNYSTNIAFPHPSNGNTYLQMPGGSTNLQAGGMKYGVSQYKSAPAANPPGYGNYTHPAGFTISSPGVIGGAVGAEDINRIKYKDSNIYVSNPLVEADIWIQQPRDVPTLTSPPFYNFSGQATPSGFMPNAGNASFNAPPPAQTSHGQFPGLYHQQQPTSMVNPHHMVQQQVPSVIGGNVGVGVAAPSQVGAYQQPQLGHLNWRPNF